MPAPVLDLRGVRRRFKTGGAEIVVLNGIDLVLAPGEVVALVGPSGRREIDPAAYRRAVGAAGRRRGADRRAGLRRPVGPGAHLAAPLQPRLRLPVPSSAAGIFGPRKRHAAAADRRRSARPGAAAGGGIVGGGGLGAAYSGTVRGSSRAASSSASRSSARSPTTPRSCSPTSRPAISTTPPATACSIRSSGSSARPASPR